MAGDAIEGGDNTAPDALKSILPIRAHSTRTAISDAEIWKREKPPAHHRKSIFIGCDSNTQANPQRVVANPSVLWAIIATAGAFLARIVGGTYIDVFYR